MGFYEENKNFIIQKFNFEMRGLEPSAQILNYNLKLKIDTRKRVINYYDQCQTSNAVFIESIVILHRYDFYFLFINLFFEENFEEIITSFDYPKFREYGASSDKILVKRFFIYSDKLKRFKDFKTIDFLRSEFCDLVEVEEYTWKNKSALQDNVFLKFYAEWLIKHLSKTENIDLVIYSAILFNKIWIEDVDFIGNHKNTKAIIFLNTLIHVFDSEMKKNNYINISSFYEKLYDVFNEIFVSGFFHTPLTDNNIEGFYSTGYYEQLKIFKSKLLVSKNLNESYSEYNFYELFLKLKESDTDTLSKQNIISKIYMKLESGIFPSTNELITIKNITEDDSFEKVKIGFFKKLYLFEFMDFSKY